LRHGRYRNPTLICISAVRDPLIKAAEVGYKEPDRLSKNTRLNGSETVDLGIKGRRAIVCASSKGLGRACAMQLASEGVHVTMTARGAEALKQAADEIRKANPGVTVTEVVGDITTPEGRAAALKACPDPDILVNNAGGPPPGDFRNWTRDDWIKAIDANMLTPIELIKATVDGMMARKFGRIVNITSAAVKAPIEVLGLSNGARAGLTGFCAGIARKTVINNVTINGLLPGPFDTDRLRGPVAKIDAEKRGITIDQLLAERAKLNPAGRFGDPEEFGQACAFLCGAKAGFITGQNILLDGGAFPGTL
jgi:3-oxoacyl-[acyl-carrier protein] reductase